MPFRQLDESELWQRIRNLCETRTPFESLVHGNKYLIVDVDDTTRTYGVEYESGNVKRIPLCDLNIIYNELYDVRRMSRDYLRKNEGRNSKRLFGNKKYTHAPGASVFALLPKLDPAIHVEEGGHLRIR